MKDDENRYLEHLAVMELKKSIGAEWVCGEPRAIPIEEMIERYYDISIEYHYLRRDLITLGQMVFDGGHVPIYDREKKRYTLIDVPPKTMLIDIRLTENGKYRNRLRFTYAHELSHYLLHRKYFTDSDQTPALLKGQERELEDRIEREANLFCSYLLIPAGQMKKAYNRLMAAGGGETVVGDMAALFGVARSTMEIRLKEHGLIG